jgi:putative hydrolase of the HAD superfamily
LNFARTWVFDLDNTLHNAGAHIFPVMNRAMTQYLQDFLDLDEAGANELRERYWLRYGATLQGLVRHHGTDPDHFLWHTHQFPALHDMVLRPRGLRAALQRLPGRKLVYSNAPIHYTRRVLQLLGIADLFEAVFTIERAGYRPKPDPHGFYRLLRQQRLNPAHCIMVEDSLANLKTAKRLGMKTVSVGVLPKRPAYVDLSVNSVLQLPAVLARLR